MEADLQHSASWSIAGGLGGIFDLEDHLIARIREYVPAFRTVASSSLIAGSTSFTSLLPAAFVEPAGGSTEEQGYGRVAAKQTWAVLVTVKHYRTRPGDASAAAVAGPLALETIHALQGWKPGDDFDYMAFDGHLDPVSQAGWAMFELRFTLGVSLTLREE